MKSPAFEKLSSVAARSYLSEFVVAMPGRAATLEHSVQSTRGWRNWRADCSRASFESLGEWVLRALRQVPVDPARIRVDWSFRSRNLAPEVKREIEARARMEKHMEFDEDSDQHCDDITMYLGMALQRAVPEARWRVVSAPSLVNYNQPILTIGKRNMGYTPLDLGSAAVYGIAERRCPPTLLASRFDDFMRTFQEFLAHDRAKAG